MVLVAVPAAILHFSVPSLRDVMAGSGSMRFGDRTAASWAPPRKLVVRGPYRHVRNPIISGVLFLLISESLLFDVPGLLVWTTVLFVGNSVYFPLIEEPGLRTRSGDDYEVSCRNVGRWIPRLTAWSLNENC